MILIRGTADEIAEAVRAISPTYPVALIQHLDPAEWHFILNGVDVVVWIIKGEENEKDHDQDD